MTLLLWGLITLVASGLLSLLAGRRPLVCTLVGAGGGAVGCAIGVAPALRVLLGGATESLQLAWDVPYGSFAVELDPLSAFFIVPIFALCGLAAIYGSHYLLSHAEHKSLGAAWFFFNLLTASMVMVALARNGVLFLVAWEIMSLASFFLVTFDDEQASVREAGRMYLIAMHLGTAFLLVFFLILGRQAGSLDFAALARDIPPETANLLFFLALVGFGTKAGFMPLHVWLPEAHPAAPSHVSAVMSGVMVKCGIYGLLRTLTLLPPAPAWWGAVLIGIGILSGVWGILFAISQHDVKRALAYSTVENVGIIALGLGSGLLGLSSGKTSLAVLGLAGALWHVINHSMFKGLLFLGAGVIVHTTGIRQVDRLGGLFKRMPAVGLAFLIGAAAITGMPPLNGFVGEFLIYLGAFWEEETLGTASASAALAVIASLALIGGLAVVAFTKLFGVAFLGEPRSEAAARAHAPSWIMTLPMLVLAAGCVASGLAAPWVVRWLEPVLVTLTREPPAEVSAHLAAMTGSLTGITQAAAILLGLIGGLAALRIGLLWTREVTQAVTWDCGYARPTARMQYTASSFVQPVVDFFAPLLRSRKVTILPQGAFPEGASLATETVDLPTARLYRPLFARMEWLFARLRWLQHGQVQLYVLYVGVTLVALLVWSFRIVPA